MSPLEDLPALRIHTAMLFLSLENMRFMAMGSRTRTFGEFVNVYKNQ